MLWKRKIFTWLSQYFKTQWGEGEEAGGVEGRGMIGTFSTNIQNQHKVLLKLYRYLDCPFEAESASQKITKLLKQNRSFPALDPYRPAAGKVVLFLLQN